MATGTWPLGNLEYLKARGEHSKGKEGSNLFHIGFQWIIFHYKNKTVSPLNFNACSQNFLEGTKGNNNLGTINKEII